VIAAYSGQEALDLVAKEKPELNLARCDDARDGTHRGVQRLARPTRKPGPHPGHFCHGAQLQRRQAGRTGSGAVDYITKPIDLDETLARVQTQLRLSAINREIIDLQRRLTESRRAATIGRRHAGHRPQS